MWRWLSPSDISELRKVLADWFDLLVIGYHFEVKLWRFSSWQVWVHSGLWTWWSWTTESAASSHRSARFITLHVHNSPLRSHGTHSCELFRSSVRLYCKLWVEIYVWIRNCFNVQTSLAEAKSTSFISPRWDSISILNHLFNYVVGCHHHWTLRAFQHSSTLTPLR